MPWGRVCGDGRGDLLSICHSFVGMYAWVREERREPGPGHFADICGEKRRRGETRERGWALWSREDGKALTGAGESSTGPAFDPRGWAIPKGASDGAADTLELPGNFGVLVCLLLS